MLLKAGVVFHLIGVPLHGLSAVLGQVKALLRLEGQVLVVGGVKGFGDQNFLHGGGLIGHQPAEALQIGHPVLIVFDAGGVRLLELGGGLGGLDILGQPQPGPQNGYGQNQQNGADGQPAPVNFFGDNEHE